MGGPIELKKEEQGNEMRPEEPNDVDIQPSYDIEHEAQFEREAQFEHAGEDSTSVQFSGEVYKRKVTLLGNIAIVFCSVTGAGILGMPFAVNNVGYLLGVLLMTISGLMAQYGLYLIGEVYLHVLEDNKENDRAGRYYFYFGNAAAMIDPVWLPLICDLLVFVMLFTICIVYLGVTGNFLEQSFLFFNPAGVGKWYQSRLFFVTVTFVAFCAPTSFLKSFNYLQGTSHVGTVFILYTVALVIFYSVMGVENACEKFLNEHGMDHCPDPTEDHDGRCCDLDAFTQVSFVDASHAFQNKHCCVGKIILWNPSFTGIIYSWPIMITAFGCVASAFKCLNEVIRPTRTRVNCATGSSLVLKLVLDIAIAVASICTFGSNISQDLLTNYPYNAVTTVARFTLGILVMITFPLAFLPAKSATIHFIEHCIKLISCRELSPVQQTWLHHGVTTFVLIIIFVLTSKNISLAVLLNFVGAVTVGQVSFLIPAWFYLKIVKPTNMFMRASCYGLITFSVLLTVLNIVVWASGNY